MQTNIAINPTDFIKAMMMPVHERRWILQQIGKSAMSKKLMDIESQAADNGHVTGETPIE